MAVRKIEYNITADGITPQAEQICGLQNEHCATEVTFNIGSELFGKISAYAAASSVKYRFDAFDSIGSVFRTQTYDFPTVNTPLSYAIGENITKNGGRIRIYLIITAVNTDINSKNDTEMELYSYPAKLHLTDVPPSDSEADTERQSLSALEAVAKAAAVSAAASAESATASKSATENARRALEEGSEFVFCGGNAQGDVSVDVVLDTVPTENSANAVQSGGVYDDLHDLKNKSNILSLVASGDFEDIFFKAAHPVGSIYLTITSDNPGGEGNKRGTWSPYAQGRAVVGAGIGTDSEGVSKTFAAGSEVGEYSHKLSTDEMPKHKHGIGMAFALSGRIVGAIGLMGNSNHFIGRGSGEFTDFSERREDMPGFEHYHDIADSGNDKAHNNIQPSIAVYVWKRTA